MNNVVWTFLKKFPIFWTFLHFQIEFSNKIQNKYKMFKKIQTFIFGVKKCRMNSDIFRINQIKFKIQIYKCSEKFKHQTLFFFFGVKKKFRMNSDIWQNSKFLFNEDVHCTTLASIFCVFQVYNNNPLHYSTSIQNKI